MVNHVGIAESSVTAEGLLKTDTFKTSTASDMLVIISSSNTDNRGSKQ